MASPPERLRPGGKPDMEKYAIPGAIEQRVKRGKARTQRDAAKRRECWSFYRNEQFVWSDAKKTFIADQQTANADGTPKPSFVKRTQRNLIVDIVAHEVSAATQRVPSYSVMP